MTSFKQFLPSNLVYSMDVTDITRTKSLVFYVISQKGRNSIMNSSLFTYYNLTDITENLRNYIDNIYDNRVSLRNFNYSYSFFFINTTPWESFPISPLTIALILNSAPVSYSSISIRYVFLLEEVPVSPKC
ncbi:hypothetical protein SAMN04487911_103117 [Arenibacter nanhaiticus]|uniref:Uncharacterized protein n=1 Tax=Arenibacter nanhaiticus TaxID=558155 RepID=A0A1M6C879_9FLAO|nr:hypothetical protein SAMN04487911_103117 [Arenibacter nanhaiticus]